MWSSRAILSWWYRGKTYRIDTMYLNANQMLALADPAATKDHEVRSRELEASYLRAADVLITVVGSGLRGVLQGGFRNAGAELRAALEHAGRDSERVPVVFMLDRLEDFDGDPYEPERLIPRFRWPRCDHVITRSANHGEGLGEVLDAAIALWESSQN